MHCSFVIFVPLHKHAICVNTQICRFVCRHKWAVRLPRRRGVPCIQGIVLCAFCFDFTSSIEDTDDIQVRRFVIGQPVSERTLLARTNLNTWEQTTVARVRLVVIGVDPDAHSSVCLFVHCRCHLAQGLVKDTSRQLQ